MFFFNGILVKSQTHQLHHTRDFFKLLRFFKKTVAKWTTGAVGDIQPHHAKQFINLQYFPVHFRINKA